jgi:hypothetical protein
MMPHAAHCLELSVVYAAARTLELLLIRRCVAPLSMHRRRARDAGLEVSVHCGETMNVAESEAVIDFRPDRLGHMCVMVSRFLRLNALATSAHTCWRLVYCGWIANGFLLLKRTLLS